MNPMWTAFGTAGVGEFVQGVFLPSPLRDIFQFWFEPGAPRMPACVDGVRLSGVLTREEVLTALERHGRRRVLGEVMRPVRKAAKSTDTVSSALRTLEMTGAGFLPVFEQGTMAGLVTTENVKAYIRFHSAQHSYKKTALHAGQTGVSQRVEAVRRV